MTERLRRSHSPRHPRTQAAAVLTILSLAAITALAPAVLAGGTTTLVTTIPGGGWIQSFDNTPGGSAQLVAGPGPGTLGNGSLQLTTAATADFAGVTHALGIPYSDLTAGAWRTFVTTSVATDAPSLRLTGYREGGISGFTTLTVELVYNGGVMPNVWQDNVLDDETIVWQTTDDGGFCNNSTFCTFGEFKQQYPDGRFTFLTVAIGTGVPAATSYTDGVSLTINEDGTETTETFDFEVVAAPTAAPTVAPPDPAPATAVPTAVPAPGGGGGGSLPDTAAGDPGSGVSVVLGSLVLISAVTTAIAWRRRLSR